MEWKVVFVYGFSIIMAVVVFVEVIVPAQLMRIHEFCEYYNFTGIQTSDDGMTIDCEVIPLWEIRKYSEEYRDGRIVCFDDCLHQCKEYAELNNRVNYKCDCPAN